MPKSDIWSLEPGKPFPQYTDAELAALPDYVAEQLSAPLRERRDAALRLIDAIRSQPGVEVVERGAMIFELAGEYDFESGITTQPHWRPGDHVVATIVVDEFNRERRTYLVGLDGVLERIPALPWRVAVNGGIVIEDPHAVEGDTSSDPRLMETFEIDRAALDRVIDGVNPDFKFTASKPREFRTRPGKLKPGSLTENGMIVAPDGLMHEIGPVIIRIDNLKTARLHAIEAAGWQSVNEVGFEDGMVMGTFIFINDWVSS